MPGVGALYTNVNPFGQSNLNSVNTVNLSTTNSITSGGQSVSTQLNEIITLSQPVQTPSAILIQDDLNTYMKAKEGIQLNTCPLTNTLSGGDFIDRSVEQSGGCLGILRNYNYSGTLGSPGDTSQAPKVLYKKYYEQTQTNDSNFSMFSCGKELISLIVANMIKTDSKLGKLSMQWNNGSSPITLGLNTTVNEIVYGTDMIGGTYNYVTPGYTPASVPSGAINPVYLPQGLGDVTIRSLLQLTAGFSSGSGFLARFFRQEESQYPYSNPLLYPNLNYSGVSACYYRNFYLTWALFLGSISSEAEYTSGTTTQIVPAFYAPAYFNGTVTPSTPKVPVILNQTGATADSAVYGVARDIWNYIMFGTITPLPSALPTMANYNAALQAILYYYGNANIYNSTSNSTYFDELAYATVFASAEAGLSAYLPNNTQLRAAAASLTAARTTLLYLQPNKNASGVQTNTVPTVDYRTSISLFMNYVFVNGHPDIIRDWIGGSPSNINPYYNMYFTLLQGITFLNEVAEENAIEFLFDPDIQVVTPFNNTNAASASDDNVVQQGYGNHIDRISWTNANNLPVRGSLYDNTSYIFLTRLLEIALSKAINNSTLSTFYTSAGYSSISNGWIANFNYYTTLSDINSSSGVIDNSQHYSGYPVHDPFYSSAYWNSLGLSTVDIITHPPLGPDSIVASTRDNFRRYVALNICVPAGISIGQGFAARPYNPVGAIAPMDQSFGYYQYGMSIYLQASKTGHIMNDYLKISLDDFLKIGSVTLKDLSTVQLYGRAVPTDLFDSDMFLDIIEGASNVDNNVHGYFPYVPATTPPLYADALEVSRKVLYSASSSGFTDISYFTNKINSNIGEEFYNSGSIPQHCLDQSEKINIYWSTGLFIQEIPGTTTKVFSFNGLNGQTCFMDIERQLVTVRCSAVLSDVPSMISDPNVYYGGSLPSGYSLQGNTGYLNKIVKSPISARDAALIGIAIVNPYPLSDGTQKYPISGLTAFITQEIQVRLSLAYGSYIWIMNLPDAFAYCAAYDKSFAQRLSFLTYQDLLGFYSYMKNTVGKMVILDSNNVPIDTSTIQSPYFKSGPITIITGADNINVIKAGTSVNASLSNPYELCSENYLLTEIYNNEIVGTLKFNEIN